MLWKVTLEPARLTFDAAAAHSVLQAAEAAGIELPARAATARAALACAACTAAPWPMQLNGLV